MFNYVIEHYLIKMNKVSVVVVTRMTKIPLRDSVLGGENFNKILKSYSVIFLLHCTFYDMGNRFQII